MKGIHSYHECTVASVTSSFPSYVQFSSTYLTTGLGEQGPRACISPAEGGVGWGSDTPTQCTHLAVRTCPLKTRPFFDHNGGMRMGRGS